MHIAFDTFNTIYIQTVVAVEGSQISFASSFFLSSTYLSKTNDFKGQQMMFILLNISRNKTINMLCK